MKLGSSSGNDYTNNSWTNNSVYVAKNNGSDGSGESGHSTTTWTIAGTAESGTSKTLDPGSGVSKTYSIVVTTKDVAGNSVTKTYTVKIDKAGPSAPTLTGGSTTYATSQKIKVSTASTDSGIGTVSYYEYYKASDSTAPTASTSGTKVTTSDNSVTFSSNIAGHYVYFRGVDSLGNKGAWSSAARVYVDTVSPTVTAKNASMTMTQGERSDTFASLFNTSWGGITTGTITYSPSSYSNLGQLPVGTHTITCTMSKNNGTSKSASVTVTVNAASKWCEECERTRWVRIL